MVCCQKLAQEVNFPFYKTFRACWHNLSCKWGAETCPQNFCQSWFILSPPPPILFYKCCHCIIYMDLNLFSDRELNYFIIFDIYNMHLSFFFLDHCYFIDVMHAWQGNTKEQRFFSILHKRFYKSLDFIWQDYCPLL